jgi:threonine dehydrogenase-like Zn-dependent dehydrogenase
VLAADLGEDKLALARQAGADVSLDARAGDLAEQVKSVTDGRGADAAIDVVGIRETLTSAMRALGMGGRLVIIGTKPQAVYGADPSFTVNPVDFLHRGLELHSSRYVTLSEIEQTLELVRQGRIKPVVTRLFELAEVQHAHELIRNNQTMGRVAMRIAR